MLRSRWYSGNFCSLQIHADTDSLVQGSGAVALRVMETSRLHPQEWDEGFIKGLGGGSSLPFPLCQLKTLYSSCPELSMFNVPSWTETLSLTRF